MIPFLFCYCPRLWFWMREFFLLPWIILSSYILFIYLFLIAQIAVVGFILLKDLKKLSGWIQRINSWAGVNQHYPTEAGFRQTSSCCLILVNLCTGKHEIISFPKETDPGRCWTHWKKTVFTFLYFLSQRCFSEIKPISWMTDMLGLPNPLAMLTINDADNLKTRLISFCCSCHKHYECPRAFS